MAGSNPDDPGFDAEFRASIRAAMLMGTPTLVVDRPTFVLFPVRRWDDADLAGAPWDWTQDPDAETPGGEKQVLCAVEPVGQGGRVGDETVVGVFDTDRVRLYLFEDEWAQVSTFGVVKLGESSYRRVKRLPPLGLFGVQVEVIECEAIDEA